MEYLTVGLQM